MWDVASLSEMLMWHQVLVYLRLQSFLLMVPVIGERAIPMRVRVSVALALTPLMSEPLSIVGWPKMFHVIVIQAAGEIAIGLAIGMCLRLLALSLSMAASAIASAVSLTQMLGIQPDQTPHPIGNLLHLAGLAILFSLGLPVMLVQMLQDSLVLWPPTSLIQSATMVPHAINLVGLSFVTALLLAAPFTLGGFLFQGLIAVVSRVMPALPISFVSAPLLLLLALATMAIVAPAIIAQWSDAVLNYELPR
jgi:flagellar biosynthetic protein FliR